MHFPSPSTPVLKLMPFPLTEWTDKLTSLYLTTYIILYLLYNIISLLENIRIFNVYML